MQQVIDDSDEELYRYILDDTEIDKRITPSVLLATRYKGEWALKSLRARRSNRATMIESLYLLLSDPSTLYIMCRRASSMTGYHFLLFKLKIEMEANILLTQCRAWPVYNLYNYIKILHGYCVHLKMHTIRR